MKLMENSSQTNYDLDQVVIPSPTDVLAPEAPLILNRQISCKRDIQNQFAILKEEQELQKKREESEKEKQEKAILKEEEEKAKATHRWEKVRKKVETETFHFSYIENPFDKNKKIPFHLGTDVGKENKEKEDTKISEKKKKKKNTKISEKKKKKKKKKS